jgi:3-oxoacyl-[acyl-carrier protein] reductase
MKLEGKVALITGAGRGIGSAAAEAFAREGANLVLNYGSAREGAEKLATKVRGLGVDAITIQADVSKPDEVQSMVKEALDKFGKIDILYNNAGILHRAQPEELTLEMWDRCIAVNLRGPFLCIKAVAESMKKQKSGRIINTVSVTAYRGSPGLDYSASKGGVLALTKSVAGWLAPYGIMVNAVCPGLVVTAGGMGGTNQNAKQIAASIPLGQRLATEEDVVKAVLFLAADASFMTGQVLVIDGGRSEIYFAGPPR